MTSDGDQSESSKVPRFTSEDFVRIASAPDRLTRNVTVIAMLDGKLAAMGPLNHPSRRPIIVGGTAVEFWSSGGYSTQDVDVVILDRTIADAILAASGFQRESRYWTLPGSDLMIEFPGRTLTYAEKGAYERAVAIVVDGIGEALVIGVEDIIVDRVCSGVFDRIPNQIKWATEMAVGHAALIDWNAVTHLASDQGSEVNVLLREIRITAEAQSKVRP